MTRLIVLAPFLTNLIVLDKSLVVVVSDTSYFETKVLETTFLDVVAVDLVVRPRSTSSESSD